MDTSNQIIDGEDAGDYIGDGDIAQEVVLDDHPEMEDEREMDMDDIEGDEEAPEGEEGGDTHFIDDSIQGFFEHREPVYAVAIHPSNPLIALSGGGDDKAYLWRMDTGEKLFELASHGDSVIDAKFSNDGTFCATGGMDGVIHVSKTESGEHVTNLEGPSEVTWIDWHPNGPVILAGGEDGSVWMWQIPYGNCMQVFTGHVDAVTSGRFTPDGKEIVTASADGSLILWNPKTGASIHRLTAEDSRFHQTAITSLAVSPDSSIILTGANDGSVRLTHSKTGKIVGSIDIHSESVEACAFSKAAPYFATASVDGKIAVWDRTTYQQRHILSHDDAVTRLQFHPIEPWLISTSMDRKICIWDVRNGQLLLTLQGHVDPILDVDISFDGQILLTGSDDGVALVYATTGQQPAT